MPVAELKVRAGTHILQYSLMYVYVGGTCSHIAKNTRSSINHLSCVFCCLWDCS